MENQQSLTMQTQNTAQGERAVSKLLKMGNHHLSDQKSSPCRYKMRGESSENTIIIGPNLTSLLRKFPSTVVFPLYY